jgi:site-specific DNA recombinase
MLHANLIYARYSKDDTDTFSIDSQIRGALAYNEKHGLITDEAYIFADEWTGMDFSRPDFDKVKRLLEQRRVANLTIYKVNRISRQDYHAMMFLREWVFNNGAQLHIVEWGRPVKDTKDDLLLFGLQAQFGTFEHIDIRERTMRGRREKAEAGIWLGQGETQYGYTKEGTKRNTLLYINEAEALIIRLIFDLFVHRRISAIDIARFLVAQGFPSPSQSRSKIWKKGDWNPQAVRRILHNENYVGNFYAFKYLMTRVDGKRKQSMRDKEEWVKFHFPNLQIVDRELFDAAQEILEDGFHRYHFPQKTEYLLGRRFKCACGFAIVGHTKHKENKAGEKYKLSYYKCNQQISKGRHTQCRTPAYYVLDIDKLVWDAIEKLLYNPELELSVLQEAQSAQREVYSDAIIDLEAIERIRAKYQADMKERYVDWKAGYITKEVYLAEKEDLDKRLDVAEAMHHEFMEKVNAKVLSDREIKYICSECHKIADYLDSIGSLEFKHKKRIIELLNVTVKYRIEETDLVLYVYIHDIEYERLLIDGDGGQSNGAGSHNGGGSHDDSASGCSIACRQWSHSRAPNTPTRVGEARAPQRHRGHRGRVPFSLLRALCGSVVKANRVGILIARTCTYHFRRPPLIPPSATTAAARVRCRSPRGAARRPPHAAARTAARAAAAAVPGMPWRAPIRST